MARNKLWIVLLAVGLLLAALVVVINLRPNERDIALDLERRVVAAIGVEPSSRRYLEREANAINDVADTVLMYWVDIDLGDQPGQTVAEMLRAAGFEVSRIQQEVSPTDPRDGSWAANIGACAPDIDRAGLIGTIGTTNNGEPILLLEVGGPPATSGCIGL